MYDLWHLIKTDRIILALFLVLFLAGYSIIGITWSAVPAFHLPDPIFSADVSRVIDDLTKAEANHIKTKVHPLFILFFNPIGTIVSLALGSQVLAAILINAFFGALNVIFFYLILRGSRLSKLHAGLFSFLLGISASHVVFGSIPETFIIASASLLLLFLLYRFFAHSRYFWHVSTLASLFSFGIISTNLVSSTIILFFGIDRSRWSSALAKVCTSVVLIIVLTVGLSMLQKYIYPSSTMLMEKFSYSEQRNWVSFDIIEKPITTLSKALPVFFLYNIVGPELSIVTTSYKLKDRVIHKNRLNISRSPTKNLNYLRLCIVLLYLSLIVIALYLAVKNNLLQEKMFLPCVYCLSFVVIFHLFYGRRELFLYSALYTFPYLLTLTLTFRQTTKTVSYLTSTILFLLCLGLLINNMQFVGNIHRVLSSLSAP